MNRFFVIFWRVGAGPDPQVATD